VRDLFPISVDIRSTQQKCILILDNECKINCVKLLCRGRRLEQAQNGFINKKYENDSVGVLYGHAEPVLLRLVRCRVSAFEALILEVSS